MVGHHSEPFSLLIRLKDVRISQVADYNIVGVRIQNLFDMCTRSTIRRGESFQKDYTEPFHKNLLVFHKDILSQKY